MTGPVQPRSAAVDELAAEVADLRSQVRALSRQPRLTNSAIDGGAVQITNGGQVTGYVGVIPWDGVTGIVSTIGPVPPVPGPATAETVQGGITVTWGGTFADPQDGFTSPVVAPSDWAGALVEVSTSSTFEEFRQYGISSAAGGTVSVTWPIAGTPLYVRVRSRSMAGKISGPSTVSGPYLSGKVGLADLGFNIEDYSGGTTIYYGAATPAVPSGGHTEGDIWHKEVGTSTGGTGQPPVGTPLYEEYRWTAGAWQRSTAQGISAALTAALLAQQDAAAKLKVFYADTAPTYTGAANTAAWYETDAGNKPWIWNGSGWTARLLGNGAIQPNSLVASNVIATGTVSAALLEALLVLVSTVVAGDPNGDHARMTPTGFRVYRADPGGGAPDEVVRMGTDTNDYLAIVDQSGKIVGSWDDTGIIHVAGATIDSDPVIMGRKFTDWVGAASGAGNGQPEILGAQHQIGWFNNAPGGVSTERALIEVAVEVSANRWYEVGCEVNYIRGADTEAVFRVRDSGGTNAPSLSSTEIYRRNFSNGQPFYDVTTGSSTGIWYPTTSGKHRLLLTAAAQGTGVIDIHTLLCLPTIICRDMGPRKPIAASASTGSGSQASPTTQAYVDLAPSGWASFRGDGSQRSDTAGPVQGYNGSNGDGKGLWWFPLPSITGTVDRADLYVYSEHWYYNSGGTGIFNISTASSAVASPTKLRGDHHISGMPKPGGTTIRLPSDWLPYFRNGGTTGSNRAQSITVGPSGGTNLTYYGRFNGPSARLRLWYTQ